MPEEITLEIEDQEMMEAKNHTFIRSLQKQMERTRGIMRVAIE